VGSARTLKDSGTAKSNTVSENRFTNMMTRLHDSGGIYTIGHNPGTNINENYVRGIAPATAGPTYGLHNDEGSAYIQAVRRDRPGQEAGRIRGATTGNRGVGP
jgi:hypothetical protein